MTLREIPSCVMAAAEQIRLVAKPDFAEKGDVLHINDRVSRHIPLDIGGEICFRGIKQKKFQV